MYVPFDEMPDHARVWIYQSDLALTADQVAFIRATLLNFTERWTAHEEELRASFTVLYDRFVILSVDEQQAGASGCSIDSSVRAIKDIGSKLRINLLDRTVIHFRNDQEINTMKLTDFQDALTGGKLTGDTIVFNNMIGSIGELRQNWEVPVKHSWHSQLMVG